MLIPLQLSLSVEKYSCFNCFTFGSIFLTLWGCVWSGGSMATYHALLKWMQRSCRKRRGSHLVSLAESLQNSHTDSLSPWRYCSHICKIYGYKRIYDSVLSWLFSKLSGSELWPSQNYEKKGPEVRTDTRVPDGYNCKTLHFLRGQD